MHYTSTSFQLASRENNARTFGTLGMKSVLHVKLIIIELLSSQSQFILFGQTDQPYNNDSNKLHPGQSIKKT